MTAHQDTGTLPYRVHLLRTVLAAKMFAFPTPEARDAFLESWAGVCGNTGIPLPVEGADYLLEGPE